MIELLQLTKEYRNHRGVFDLSFRIEAGEVFGYLGPNGAGKSTTIRHLMGFLRPDSGVARIGQLDCWREAAKVQQHVGYLPGEIAFLEGMTGRDFINLLAGMRKMTSVERRDQLMGRFELDASVPIRKMSKGMKQKVGIVAAMMHGPAVLILDEPTSGLDPLMQQRFLETILEEKRRGTTVLMSSHNFAEVERVCDRVGIIKDGRLVAVESMANLKTMQTKVFSVSLRKRDDVTHLTAAGYRVVSEEGNNFLVEVQGNDNTFVQALAKCDVMDLRMHELNLEQVFMHYYGEERGVAK